MSDIAASASSSIGARQAGFSDLAASAHRSGTVSAAVQVAQRDLVLSQELVSGQVVCLVVQLGQGPGQLLDHGTALDHLEQRRSTNTTDCTSDGASWAASSHPGRG